MRPMPEQEGYSRASDCPCPTSSTRSVMRSSLKARHVSALRCHKPAGSRTRAQISRPRQARKAAWPPAAQASAASAQMKPSMDRPVGLSPCRAASRPASSIMVSSFRSISPGRAAPESRICSASPPQAKGSRAQPRAARGRTISPSTGSQIRLRMKQGQILPKACRTMGSVAVWAARETMSICAAARNAREWSAAEGRPG